MNDHCRRSRHTFNPAPGSVKRSDLLGVCPACQAETVLTWYNRRKWERGDMVPAEHTHGCVLRNAENYYRGR